MSQVLQDRRAKLATMREKNINPYANSAEIPVHTSKNIIDFIGICTDQELETRGRSNFSIAGRVISSRIQGKAGFLDLSDRDGKIQIYAKLDILGQEQFSLVKNLDEGDIIFVSGSAKVTKTNQPSLIAEKITFLTKNLQPIGDKFHGVTNVETRYRKRYIDLNADSQAGFKVREVFKTRSKIIQKIRTFFAVHDFMEVETPIFHHGVSGANARPFHTHHNALDIDLHLRIAPELYLKRLLVGGFERVYEIGKNFRNEGISTNHNPEFTMLEFYFAYAKIEDLMTLTEELLHEIAMSLSKDDIHSSDKHFVISYQGHEISLKAPFTRMTMKEAILTYFSKSQFSSLTLEHHLLDNEDLFLEFLSQESFKDVFKNKNLTLLSHGERISLLFEMIAEPFLIQPTFITNFPIEVSPLSRRKENDSSIAERFEFYMAGKEISNAFNELNDPEDQKQRFQEQLNKKQNGNQETMDYDEDYIHALEVGMPPAAGQGIGIDRLVMLFTDSPSIRDVILFPLLRP